MCAEWPYHGRISRSHARSPWTSVQSCRLIAGLIRMRSTSGRLAARRSSVISSCVHRAGVYSAPIRPHHARQLHRLALRRGQRALGPRVQPDIDVEAQLMAQVPARQRTSARSRDVLDIEIAQPRRAHLRAQGFDARDGRRRTPERAARQVDGLEARPLGWQPHRAGDATGCLAADDVQWTRCRRVASRRDRQDSRDHGADPPEFRTAARTP